jgi:hypothetical protein
VVAAIHALVLGGMAGLVLGMGIGVLGLSCGGDGGERGCNQSDHDLNS